jgi:3-hydroxyisobutyrate dehydrogenase-like beta-hydroxyacid dehydrogenase
MSATGTSVGFVGLGHMGGNMAARFLAAGYPVYGEQRGREGAGHLIEQGLRWCDTPRAVAEASNVVFTSVPDDEALENVASGDDGILAGLGQGKMWIDVSTVSPQVSRELAGRANAQGASMLDAPVSGSVPQGSGRDADNHGGRRRSRLPGSRAAPRRAGNAELCR